MNMTMRIGILACCGAGITIGGGDVLAAYGSQCKGDRCGTGQGVSPYISATVLKVDMMSLDKGGYDAQKELLNVWAQIQVTGTCARMAGILKNYGASIYNIRIVYEDRLVQAQGAPGNKSAACQKNTEDPWIPLTVEVKNGGMFRINEKAYQFTMDAQAKTGKIDPVSAEKVQAPPFSNEYAKISSVRLDSDATKQAAEEAKTAKTEATLVVMQLAIPMKGTCNQFAGVLQRFTGKDAYDVFVSKPKNTNNCKPNTEDLATPLVIPLDKGSVFYINNDAYRYTGQDIIPPVG